MLIISDQQETLIMKPVSGSSVEVVCVPVEE